MPREPTVTTLLATPKITGGLRKRVLSEPSIKERYTGDGRCRPHVRPDTYMVLLPKKEKPRSIATGLFVERRPSEPATPLGNRAREGGGDGLRIAALFIGAPSGIAAKRDVLPT